MIEDLARIVLDFAVVRIGEHCVHRDGKEAVEVLDGLDQSNRIQQGLHRVNCHLCNVRILDCYLQCVDYLEYQSLFEVLLLAKLVREDNLDHSNELHQ